MNDESALAFDKAKAHNFEEVDKVLNQRESENIAEKEAVFGEDARLAEIEEANLLRGNKSIVSAQQLCG